MGPHFSQSLCPAQCLSMIEAAHGFVLRSPAMRITFAFRPLRPSCSCFGVRRIHIVVHASMFYYMCPAQCLSMIEAAHGFVLRSPAMRITFAFRPLRPSCSCFGVRRIHIVVHASMFYYMCPAQCFYQITYMSQPSDIFVSHSSMNSESVLFLVNSRR